MHTEARINCPHCGGNFNVSIDGDLPIGEISESRCFGTWLLWIVLGTVVTVLVSATFGAIIGMLLGAGGVAQSNIILTTSIIGAVMGTIASYVVFRFAIVPMIIKWVAKVE